MLEKDKNCIDYRLNSNPPVQIWYDGLRASDNGTRYNNGSRQYCNYSGSHYTSAKHYRDIFPQTSKKNQSLASLNEVVVKTKVDQDYHNSSEENLARNFKKNLKKARTDV